VDILKALSLGGVAITTLAFIISIVGVSVRKRKYIKEILYFIGALCLVGGKIKFNPISKKQMLSVAEIF